MKRTLAIGLILLVGAATANAATIAYWNFNDGTNIGTSLFRINPLGDTANKTQYSADIGTGKVSVWGTGGGTLVGTNGQASGTVVDNFGSFTGSTINAQGSDPAGGSLSIVGSANNNAYFLIKLSDQIANATLSYASRVTSTGFGTEVIDYSTNGGASWTNLTTLTKTKNSTYYLETVSLGNIFAASGGTDVNVLRITVSGASSTNGSTRFDNVLVTGDIVPEPATMALLGLGGLAVFRRRR